MSNIFHTAWSLFVQMDVKKKKEETGRIMKTKGKNNANGNYKNKSLYR